MKIETVKDANRQPRRRIKRHGDEVDLVLEHFINGKSASYGLLFKARKSGRYIWFDRKQLKPIPFYDGDKVPTILEGVDTYTPNSQLLYEYLDHLIVNVLSKRDQKRFGTTYENVKADQLSLIDRLNLA